MTTPQPNLLPLKKAQAIWRGVLTAEVLKFPTEKRNVAFTLLKAATRLEKSSPEGCIALERRAIALMALLWGTQVMVRRQLESQQTDRDDDA